MPAYAGMTGNLVTPWRDHSREGGHPENGDLITISGFVLKILFYLLD
jgi:hypothetical protein